MTNSHPRKRYAVPIVAAIAVVACLSALTLYKQHPRSSDAPSAPAPDATTMADNASTVIRRLPRNGAGMSEDAKRAIGAVVASRLRQQGDEERRFAGARSAAANAYAAETVDPQWAAQKESELRKIAGGPAMTAADVHPNDIDMQCKRTMCRLDASFANQGDGEDWVLAFMSSLGSATRNSVVTRERRGDGSFGVVILSKAR